VLFSEPKIPQYTRARRDLAYKNGFSALQRAENSSIVQAVCPARVHRKVSVLFSEPKIPQSRSASNATKEPRRFSALQRAENSSIPVRRAAWHRGGGCFSALQRAENSSIAAAPGARLDVIDLFQCSSASRKFLNPRTTQLRATAAGRFSALQRAENSSIRSDRLPNARKPRSFSALQRAENSSIRAILDAPQLVNKFQCSSASRKFLNQQQEAPPLPTGFRFSALQRAENSSIPSAFRSSPGCPSVSVLFSEPKIPQSYCAAAFGDDRTRFQCSSASRKFLNGRNSRLSVRRSNKFQCSSASRKFLNLPSAERRE